MDAVADTQEHPWMLRAVAPDGESVILKPVEARAETYSLEHLQTRRRALVAEFTPLEFLYGSGGDRATATRRQHRDGIGGLLLREMREAMTAWNNAHPLEKQREWKDPSEAALERMANGDIRHTEFCSKLEGQFDRWYQLRVEMSEIDEQIRSREIELACYRNEIGAFKG